MNMPLLYWASSETGEARYAEAATRHVDNLRKHIVRGDDTTFHTFHWDPVTGEPSHGSTAQGSSDDSCWARGQAWGIYGFAFNARHAGDPTLLETATRCAEYFLAHLPADKVAFWDLVFTDGDPEPRDSSSSAIPASGLLELAGQIAQAEPDRAERYRAAAQEMLVSLATSYTGASEGIETNALLLHGVYSLPHGKGVDEGNLWGDYYYLEALTRLARPEWVPFW